MPPPSSSLHTLRHNAALSTLLEEILQRIARDLPDAVGLSVIARDDHGVEVLAHHGGLHDAVVGVQLRHHRGPIPDALVRRVPVLSPDLLHDARWPDLGPRIRHDVPATLTGAGADIVGAAAVPDTWGPEATVVLAGTLNRPADPATLTTLFDYERLIHAALTAASADVTDALNIVGSRATIEQAKGAIMGRLGCDANHAFTLLRETSQRRNVKLRDVCTALLEDLPLPAVAHGSSTSTPVTPGGTTRRVARCPRTALEEIVDPPTRSS